MEDKWKELLKYIAENRFMSSPFLYPEPHINIEVIGLLDKIAELRGIDKIENGKEFNSIIDEINNQTHLI